MKYLLNKNKNIRFNGADFSHKNGEAEHDIKKLFTTERTILIHYELICTEEKISTDIWPTTMDYAVWIYNMTPGTQSIISDIEILSRSRFDKVT